MQTILRRIIVVCSITILGLGGIQWLYLNVPNSPPKIQLTQNTPNLNITKNSNRCNGIQDTILRIGKYEVEIINPINTPIADLLVLPGWNYGRRDWGDKTELFKQARLKGYRLILPDMQKSLYTTTIYPETKLKFRPYPTLLWLTDTVIPYLQNEFKIFSTYSNYIIGLSTGAKGGALVSMRTDTLFQAAVLLSGDYALEMQPNDILNVSFLGSYAHFPARWQGDNNPIDNINQLKTALYIGHGRKDQIVPVAQSISFYEKIAHQKNKSNVYLNINDTASHNYGYWNSELVAAFLFFEKNRAIK